MARQLEQVEADETKQVIAQSIREAQAKEDEENKKLEDDFFATLNQTMSAQAQAA